MNETITTLDCGHPPTPTEGVGTGTARRHDGTSMCYACAGEEERQSYRDAVYGDVRYGYVKPALDLSQPSTHPDDIRAIEITTWPGAVLGKGFVDEPRWGVGGKVQYATVLIEGRHWHGRYYRNAGDSIALRLYKEQP